MPATYRLSLDCQALPWQVLHVEESESPTRPPFMVLLVAITPPLADITAVERATASLLIEGPDVTRVVRGWVRYVEHVAVVDSRAHLRLHLVPMAMAEDATARESAPRGAAPGPAPRRRRSTEEDTAAHGTRLVTYTEMNAVLASQTSGDASSRPGAATKQRRSPPRIPVRTGGTQLMSREDLERLKAGVLPEVGASAGPGPERHAEPSPRQAREDETEELVHTKTERLSPPSVAAAGRRPKATAKTERLRLVSDAVENDRPPLHRGIRSEPGRKRRMRRNSDDRTHHMTREEIEALQQHRSKPRT